MVENEAPDRPEDEEMGGVDSLGRKVRILRESRHLSVRTLAKRSGFSASFISQVENDQASPSIASMEKIAQALNVTMSEFFARHVNVDDAPVVVRAGDGEELVSEWSHGVVRALSPLREGRILSPVLLTLQPGGRSGASPASHEGEEFAMILSGIAQLRLSEVTHELEVGDSIHLAPGIEHVWENPGDAQVLVLLVTSGF